MGNILFSPRECIRLEKSYSEIHMKQRNAENLGFVGYFGFTYCNELLELRMLDVMESLLPFEEKTNEEAKT